MAAAAEMGHEPPADCIPPNLPEECIFAHSAFNQLSSDRHIGFDAGQIPWTAINAYAVRYKITDIDDFESFAEMIRVMDKVYLSHNAPKDTQ